MKNKCPNCNLVNFPNAEICARCGASSGETDSLTPNQNATGSKLLRRALVCVLVSGIALTGFYVSLIYSAASLSYEQKRTVQDAISILEEKGFASEVFLLKRLAVYRGNDNWLNASVIKENAFAATNFPFEIITLYPDFFKYPIDDTERAAILLHEAKHLQGKEEKEAYEFVWRNRKKLGWISTEYSSSNVWNEVRKQTQEFSPNLFVCETSPLGDCTE